MSAEPKSVASEMISKAIQSGFSYGFDGDDTLWNAEHIPSITETPKVLKRSAVGEVDGKYIGGNIAYLFNYGTKEGLRINKTTNQFQFLSKLGKWYKGNGIDSLVSELAKATKAYYYAREGNWTPPVCRQSLETAVELKAALEKHFHFRFTLSKYRYYGKAMASLTGYVPDHLSMFEERLTGFCIAYAYLKRW